MGAGVSDSLDLAFNTPVSEASGNQDTADIAQKVLYVFRSDGLRIHPLDIHGGPAEDTAVLQGFHHADIGVVELDIFSDQGNGNLSVGMLQVIDHFCPVLQVRIRAGQVQTFTYHACQIFLFHGQRSFI